MTVYDFLYGIAATASKDYPDISWEKEIDSLELTTNKILEQKYLKRAKEFKQKEDRIEAAQARKAEKRRIEGLREAVVATWKENFDQALNMGCTMETAKDSATKMTGDRYSKKELREGELAKSLKSKELKEAALHVAKKHRKDPT